MVNPTVSLRHTLSTILVVDDTEFNRVIVCDILSKAGFKNLLEASNGVEALEIVKSQPVDLIITDLVMPNLDGFGFCKQFFDLNLPKRIPVLVQTAMNDPNERLEIFNAGASDLLVKPINPKELISRISLHLDYAFSINDLAQYQHRMEEELALAQETQRALMPEPDDLESLVRSHKLAVLYHYQPSLKIGGDLWGMSAIHPDRIGFFAFDISGHGISAAIQAFRLHLTIHLPALLDMKPAELMQEINARATHMFKPGQFAVCILGVIDTKQGVLEYSSAGFTAPLLLSASSGEVQALPHHGIPVGIDEKISYETHRFTFSKGDSLLLYSDALIESPCGTKAQALSESAIAAIMKQSLARADVSNNARAHAIDALVSTVSECEGEPAIIADDLMIVLMSQT